MEENRSINLITQTKIPGSLSHLIGNLQKTTVTGLTIFVIVSLLVGGVYAVLRLRLTTLTSARDRLRSQITAQAEAEALLVALKQRGIIVGKIIQDQIHWVSTLSRMTEIAPPPALSSIAVDAKRRVVATIQTNTTEEMFPILAEILTDTENKKILSPQVSSFGIDKEGISRLVITFIPVL